MDTATSICVTKNTQRRRDSAILCVPPAPLATACSCKRSSEGVRWLPNFQVALGTGRWVSKIHKGHGSYFNRSGKQKKKRLFGGPRSLAPQVGPPPPPPSPSSRRRLVEGRLAGVAAKPQGLRTGCRLSGAAGTRRLSHPKTSGLRRKNHPHQTRRRRI